VNKLYAPRLTSLSVPSNGTYSFDKFEIFIPSTNPEKLPMKLSAIISPKIITSPSPITSGSIINL